MLVNWCRCSHNETLPKLHLRRGVVDSWNANFGTACISGIWQVARVEAATRTYRNASALSRSTIEFLASNCCRRVIKKSKLSASVPLISNGKPTVAFRRCQGAEWHNLQDLFFCPFFRSEAFCLRDMLSLLNSTSCNDRSEFLQVASMKVSTVFTVGLKVWGRDVREDA